MSPEVAEALARGGVVWVALEGHPPRALWHVWRDDAVHVVVGGDEQPLPGAETARRAVLTVRDRTGGGRLAELPADVERLEPGTPDWDAAVALLAPERLNADDVAALPARWAAGSAVLRLRPC